MPKVKFEISISADGYVAGPNQSEDDPLGEGGMRLHEWVVKLEAWRELHGEGGGEVNASTEVVEQYAEGIGAVVMGRNMFGGGPGPWDDSWRGWWGEEPPFHVPVFVVTHHEREPLVMDGGTTFHFVTDGIEPALARAREAASGQDVRIGGGASIGRQYLAAGLVDELQLNLVPVLLGAGERLFENVGADLALEQTRVLSTPEVTHIRYRVEAGPRTGESNPPAG
jgi:dihydrofolate reductase